MADILSVRIDVTKIDKSKLYKGEKGTYLDVIILMKDEPDQYQNIGMVTQSISKEEREAGGRGAILGNAKRIGVSNKTAPAAPKKTAEEVADDDLPF